ncbi:phosphate ABC transporter substrate-binding protein [Solirubrobacter sp. CPCC 204708]|uniref:Phosphate ABC transporter substrate-binding protein n=1 Tax=Solirubrobacter deserti TaxID=2282478 RepID=A0ABT4RTR6_9ACTN|nr:phosphate ABC transporter substrate-binding protein [Solirubrobacter deserti]MBE2320030.1 phosphate ABC transporter substrate-binding protein [Solirubrobacter deserti]MDA0141974.1 phosphate ABC transporter substrate-binding protein [Solirubrobacter deserti]
MKRSRLLLLAAGTLAAATFPTAAHAQSKILMSGSTSVYPLTADLIKAYKKNNPNTRFTVSQGGSDVGIGDVARKRVNIGMSSRDQQSGDPGGLNFYKIARDGVCIATHPDNNLANLSQQNVQDIFSGKVRRWQDVPGAKVTGPINLNVRTQASGTQDAFRNIFMGPSLNVTPSASQKASNGLVQTAIRSDRNAIGYLDVNFTQGTYPVPYKGVACNLRNAKSGQYPGVRNFWFVTVGPAKGEVKKFIDFARSSSTQSSVVAKKYVPYR